MVGVPVLFWACDSACVPLTWVMVVAVGVSWWCVFQWCVAVVWVSRRVPGVGVCVCVLVCSGVGWLVSGVSGAGACVAGLVCVLWFRMLMRVLLSVFFCFVVLVLLVCFVNNAAWAGWFGLVRGAGCVVWGGVLCVWGVLWVCVVIGLLSLLLVKVCVCGRLCVCEGCECSACLLV